jgi:hypothetical protein
VEAVAFIGATILQSGDADAADKPSFHQRFAALPPPISNWTVKLG